MRALIRLPTQECGNFDLFIFFFLRRLLRLRGLHRRLLTGGARSRFGLVTVASHPIDERIDTKTRFFMRLVSIRLLGLWLRLLRL